MDGIVIDIERRLFVYGTLAPGKPNEHVLKPLGGTWQAGTVRGRRLMQGWGAELGYPGMVVDAAGEEIAGLLFTAEKLAGFWATLDELEGADYERVVAPVQLEDGSVAEAYVYALKGE